MRLAEPHASTLCGSGIWTAQDYVDMATAALFTVRPKVIPNLLNICINITHIDNPDGMQITNRFDFYRRYC